MVMVILCYRQCCLRGVLVWWHVALCLWQIGDVLQAFSRAGLGRQFDRWTWRLWGHACIDQARTAYVYLSICLSVCLLQKYGIMTELPCPLTANSFGRQIRLEYKVTRSLGDAEIACHVPISTFCCTMWSQSTNVIDGQTDVLLVA